MDAKLIVVGGQASKDQIALKLPTVIGRSKEASLTIAHPMVSRQHCELFEQKGLLMIRDKESLNGTTVGKQRIMLAPLPPNAEFTVGPLTFRVDYKYQGDLSKLPAPVLVEPTAGKDQASNAQATSDSSPIDFEALPSDGGEDGVSLFFDDLDEEAAAEPAAAAPAAAAPAEPSPPPKKKSWMGGLLGGKKKAKQAAEGKDDTATAPPAVAEPTPKAAATPPAPGATVAANAAPAATNDAIELDDLDDLFAVPDDEPNIEAKGKEDSDDDLFDEFLKEV